MRKLEAEGGMTVPTTYSLVKSAIQPGDVIYVLHDGEHYAPTKVLSIQRKSLLTEAGEILFEDHGWLWRCLKPKEEWTR